MKQEINNEIDLLLRRMARGDDGARNGEAQTAESHLDADEISSYAQNALPAAARARYTEHLTDCATCRKLVTELSLSLGTAVADSDERPHEASGFWQRLLASLFSPLVLRYAVPALGVIVVMIVGFVVLRRQGQSEYVAKLDQQREVSSPATPTPSINFSTTQPKMVDRLENGNAQVKDAQPKDAQPKSPSGSETAAAAAPAPAPSGPAKDDRSVAAEVKPGTAAESAASPAAAKAAPTPGAQTETVVISQNQPTASLQTLEPARAKETPARDEDQQNRAGSSKSTTQNKVKSEPSVGGFTGGIRGVATVGRREEAKPADEKKSDETAQAAKPRTADEETRTIAGRRFRKQRGIWIDTAYESSTNTVDMTRDSEQFRALVADEPAIGTISKQLDGEVIVVWKGHAYRIR